jgi:hypothetical protein
LRRSNGLTIKPMPISGREHMIEEIAKFLILMCVVGIMVMALWISTITFFEIFGEEKDDDDINNG